LPKVAEIGLVRLGLLRLLQSSVGAKIRFRLQIRTLPATDRVLTPHRIVFALVFLFSGSTVHLLQARQGIAYARMYPVPAPELLVPLSGLMAVLGALSVILGIWADLGALLLVAFLVPVAFFMHAFWRETDEQTKANQMAHFMKNMALAGGALVLFYTYNQLQGDAGLSITDPLFARG
jgi:putative oxidoreductase